MEFGILGPLRVLRDGAPLVMGGVRQRTVLARLLIEPARVVTASALIDDVWSGRPPATAAKTLQKYVSVLRRILGPEVVCTDGGGYAIDLSLADLDARRFEELVRAGDHRP